MITLRDLQYATGGQLFGDAVAEQFSGFCTDSRQANSGEMFVAITTSKGDSHRYIEDAIQRGASGVLCENPPTCDVTDTTVVIVGDTVAALGQWAAYVLRQYNTTLIGVTGEIGKSLTQQAIVTVLSTRHQVYNNLGRTGRIDIPIGLGGLKPSDEIVLIELSTRYLGEMPELLTIAPPHIGVITNISPSNLVNRGEFNQVRVECQQLIDSLPNNGMVIANNDDTHIRELLADYQGNFFTYGQQADSEPGLLAHAIHYHADEIGFDLRYGTRHLPTHRVPLLGRPGMYATLAALSIGLVFDIPLEESIRALTNFQSLPGRLNILAGGHGSLLIDDSYNATPASTMAALDFLAASPIRGGRRIFVLGDMDSQGEAAEQSHREVGRRAAQVADLFVTQGTLASIAGRAARWVGMPADRTIPVYSHTDTARIIRNYVGRGDVVLITGGQQAQMERALERLLQNTQARRDLPRQDYLSKRRHTHNRTWPSWIELDLEGVVANIRQIQGLVGPNVAMMARVDSNAYGHGAELIASTAINNGVSMLGVASLHEGLHLRDAGINAPILILGHTATEQAQQAILNNLTLTVYDLESARIYDLMARELQREIKVHIRIDSGLGQLGLFPDQVVPLVRDLVRMESLTIDGIYTEFSSAGNLLEAAATRDQLNKFRIVLDSLQASGLRIPHIHAASSAALIALPESHFTMVRLGVLLYGLHPSADVRCPPGFQRVLTWKTSVVQVKKLPTAWPVGYGRTYQAQAEERIAIIPVGFGDGFRGVRQSWGEVLIRGRRAQVIGQVAMNQSVIHVSHIPDVQAGDEVVLIGRQGNDEINVEDVALRQDSNSHEILSGLSHQIPRIG